MAGTVAVDVKDLTIKFGDFVAVNHISFQVQQGEIFGFLGANGAGKTTTIRMLCGLLEPTHGDVQIAGESYRNGADFIKKNVGYMSQKFTLYNDLTVAENLWFNAQLRKLDRHFAERRMKELFDFIRFDQSRDTLVRHLAGGLKQELSLVAALLHDPDLIFLDEPTAGVAPSSRKRFWGLIHQLSKRGKTIFVTTHYMDEAEECHRIALMRSGEIIALDSPAQLKASTFPEILLEVEPVGPVTENWVSNFKTKPGVLSLVPYGRRFHAIVESTRDVQWLEREYSGQCRLRTMVPSLEDVFIRLVEGSAR